MVVCRLTRVNRDRIVYHRCDREGHARTDEPRSASRRAESDSKLPTTLEGVVGPETNPPSRFDSGPIRDLGGSRIPQSRASRLLGGALPSRVPQCCQPSQPRGPAGYPPFDGTPPLPAGEDRPVFGGPKGVGWPEHRSSSLHPEGQNGQTVSAVVWRPRPAPILKPTEHQERGPSVAGGCSASRP